MTTRGGESTDTKNYLRHSTSPLKEQISGALQSSPSTASYNSKVCMAY